MQPSPASFLDSVESTWLAFRGSMPGDTPSSNRRTIDNHKLVIEIEAGGQSATVEAWEWPPSLVVTVMGSWKKIPRVLFDGACTNRQELERRLHQLCAELSASPFA
jgi:hypothetical protein